MTVTTDAAGATRRTHELLHGMRRAIGSLRAATETMQGYPEAEPAVRARLLGVVAEETDRLHEQVRALEQELGRSTPAEQSRRSVVPAAEVTGRLRAALVASGLDCESGAPGADAEARVRVDLEALAQATETFFTALRRQTPVGACSLRQSLRESHLLLDVGWAPGAADVPHLLAWQGGALAGGGAGDDAGLLRSVARAHDGEAWFALERDGLAAHVRLLLPTVADAAG